MNRRQVLKNTGLLTTAAALTPFSRVLGANGHLRVAVIGLHGRGKSHLNGVLSHSGVRLAALCDVDSDILAKTAADLGKNHGVKGLQTFSDYRKVCENKDIDAVMIATPNHTHTLIAVTAAANGKHVYVEKPVSHNIHEGRLLAQAQEKFRVVIAHGFQHRSNSSWSEMFAWLKDEPLGKLTLARGFCYKPRPSIGKVAGPQDIPKNIDYNLWSGPREMLPLRRKQFHYDWHWQSPYGNGDLGNQGPHQLDVCRWAIGDPRELPDRVLSLGGRFGHDDDGDVANTQVVFYDTKPVPIIFEVRGLPKKNLNYKTGMDDFHGLGIGNYLEFEGGRVTGDHRPNCIAYDNKGKVLKKSSKRGNSFHSFFNAVLGKEKQAKMQAAESGHLSAAYSHLGNHSLKLGKSENQEKIAHSLDSMPHFSESYQRMMAHLDANGLDDIKVGHGVPLGMDEKEHFIGDFAARARQLDQETYRDPFKLPSLV